jgi:hypothetical protein
MSIVRRDIEHYITRNQFTFDLAKRDKIIELAEKFGLQETMGSQGKNWHLSDATLEEFDARVRHSRPDLLAKNATQASATHVNTSSDVPSEVRMLSGEYFDRLPPDERLRLSNSHRILRADDGAVTLQRR